MKSPLFLLCLTLPAFVSANEEIESGSANPFADAMGRKAMVDVMYEPEADLEKGGEFSYRDVELAVPVYGGRLTDAWFYGFRAWYRLSEFELPASVPHDGDLLHRADLRASLIYRPEGSPWMGFLAGGPALATDGETINSDDVLWTAIFGLGYRFSDTFTLLAGGFFSQEFGEPRLLGAPGFVWTPSEEWAASLIGPRFRVAYAPSSDWRIALEAKPDGGRWSIDTPEGSEAYLDRGAARAGLRIERRISAQGWLHFGAGWMFARELRVESSSGRELYDSDVDDGLYIATGLSWRF